nr:NAD(P)H-dependent glycerol-3-phosphate dehydrogenase [Poseidonocella pacifica]
MQPPPYNRVAVIGAGSWGTALATIAARNGRQTKLWGRNPKVIRSINAGTGNPTYLPGVALPRSLLATDDLAAALADAEAVILVTPSPTIRAMSAAIREHLAPGVPVTLCSKGIETQTGLLLSQVVEAELPGHPVGALSGPTFAGETALGHPTAATIAFPFSYEDRLNPSFSPAARMAVTMGDDMFRPYISDDLIGVEVGGAVKNVIAIACGMMTGAGFAQNTRAALITRGIDEMKLLAEALGGRRETVTGLSGAGDLTLTCSSETSRNMSLGKQLGEGLLRSECFGGKPVVVEGEVNAVSVIDLSRRIGVPMPICEAVHNVLHNGGDLRETFAELWSRPMESEPRTMDIAAHHAPGVVPANSV